MHIEDGIKLNYENVLIKPKRSKSASRKDVKLERDFKFYHSPATWFGVPLIVSNMSTTGTIAMAQSLAKHSISVCLHKFYDIQRIRKEYLDNMFVSIGMGKHGLHLSDLVSHKKRWSPNICVDVANGYTDDFVKYCSDTRNEFPNSIIMAGNICTPEMVQELILHGGVDICKVGIAHGGFCRTKNVTGVGYPQLSATIECADVAHGLTNGPGKLGLICSDGGIKQPGDVAKSIGGGADFVMMGSMFTGCDECEGEWRYDQVVVDVPRLGDEPLVVEITRRGKKLGLKCFGMSSYEAQDQFSERADYRASEGACEEVPYKGPAETVVKEILGGLRSACTYVGTNTIKDLSACTTFIKVK